MLFFIARAAPDPAGLILDAAEAARRRAMRLTDLRAAAVQTRRVLARARRNRQGRR
jgi:hypothetical protein